MRSPVNGLFVASNSNTTLVKVKFKSGGSNPKNIMIQIQLLLKLNVRKINICNFYYTIKSIDKQGF